MFSHPISKKFNYTPPISIRNSIEHAYSAFSRQFNIDEKELRDGIFHLELDKTVLVLKQDLNPTIDSKRLSLEEMLLQNLLIRRMKSIIYNTHYDPTISEPISNFTFSKNYKHYAPGLLQHSLAKFINEELEISSRIDSQELTLGTIDKILKTNSSAIIIVKPDNDENNFRIIKLIVEDDTNI